MLQGYLKTTDGAYIYYEEEGSEKESILLVPGHMCTTKFYKKNVEDLSKKYRVVTMDNRGFGNSSKPLHGNNVERHADDIKELIDYLKLENVTLIGWSLSGSIVVEYAHKYNCYKLLALGLLDCCLFPFSPADWNHYNSKNYNMDDWNTKYRLWYADPETYLDNFCSRVNEGLTKEEQIMVREEIKKTPPWIGFALHSDWCQFDATKYLSELTVPVIIFSGESKGHSSSMGDFYMEEVQTYCEHHKFSKGGHILFLINYKEFDEMLDKFIQKSVKEVQAT